MVWWSSDPAFTQGSFSFKPNYLCLQLNIIGNTLYITRSRNTRGILWAGDTQLRHATWEQDRGWSGMDRAETWRLQHFTRDRLPLWTSSGTHSYWIRLFAHVMWQVTKVSLQMVMYSISQETCTLSCYALFFHVNSCDLFTPGLLPVTQNCGLAITICDACRDRQLAVSSDVI